jgi:hypothetical protein
MDKVTQLFIRACKSINPDKRLQSVYKRFYGSKDMYSEHISVILLKICQDYNLLTLESFASKIGREISWILSPVFNRHSKTVDYNSYLESVNSVCISAIRLTKVSKLEGFTAPRKFR